MTAFQANLLELFKQQNLKIKADALLKWLWRNWFLILVMLWSPLLVLQTWNLQHSCEPLVNWGGDRCPIETVTIQPRTLAIKVGRTQQLKADVRVKASVKNARTIDRGVQWVSSDPKIATVNPQGQVVAVTPGQAKITAISNKDTAQKDTVDLVVEGIKNVEIQPRNLEIEVGHSRILEAKVNGFGRFSSAVSWFSSNPEVAVVDRNGLVKGVAEGKASIQAVANQNSHKRASTPVKVSQTIEIERVVIAQLVGALWVGEERPILATVEGLGANSNDIVWSSSNPNVAKINGQGREVQLEAKSPGEATVTATSNQDPSKQDTIELKILPSVVTQVSLRPKKLDLNINSQGKLCTSVEGKGLIDRSLSWSSSNGEVATVDSDGIITPQTAGKTQITATSLQNPEQKATATITVSNHVNWLAIGIASLITAGAAVVGVPLPVAIALGSASATAIHNWQGVSSVFCR